MRAITHRTATSYLCDARSANPRLLTSLQNLLNARPLAVKTARNPQRIPRCPFLRSLSLVQNGRTAGRFAVTGLPYDLTFG